MRIGPNLAVALAVVSSIAAPCAAQPEATKVALLAGVNQYDSPEFSSLDYAERDIEVLGQELRKHGFTVVVLKGSSKGTERATRDNILGRLRGLFPKPNRNALTLVALSGHGQQLRTRLSDTEFRDENYFCPVDGVSSKADTLVSLSEITDDILRKHSGRNLMLIDACRDVADARGRGKSRGIQGKDVALPEGIAVLFSCRAEQKSYESPGLKHGLFTYSVIEGLRGKAALQGKDTVDWDGLASYVKSRLKDADMRAKMSEGPQDAISAGGVEFTVLARVATTSQVAAASTNPTPTASAPGEFAGAQAGDQRDDNSLKLKLVWCPAGKFLMGSPPEEPGRSAQEDQATVTLTQGFWLGRFEVTQAEYEQVMGTNPSFFSSQGERKHHVSGISTSRFPVENVRWNDAREFCTKLTSQEQAAGRLPANWRYDLPTEAQWEYACRAGTTTASAYGNPLSSEDANLDGSEYPYNGAERGPNVGRPTDVGSYEPNAWGLCDMHGNVSEWCRDWMAQNLPGGSDPEVSVKAAWRARRGGCWIDSGVVCRSAARDGVPPGDRYQFLGFRVAVVPVKK